MSNEVSPSEQTGPKTLGAWIRVARKVRGLQVKQAAALAVDPQETNPAKKGIGVSSPIWTRYETDNVSRNTTRKDPWIPRGSTVRRIASALSVTPEFVLQVAHNLANGLPPESAPSPNSPQDRRKTEAASILEQLIERGVAKGGRDLRAYFRRALEAAAREMEDREDDS